MKTKGKHRTLTNTESRILDDKKNTPHWIGVKERKKMCSYVNDAGQSVFGWFFCEKKTIYSKMKMMMICDNFYIVLLDYVLGWYEIELFFTAHSMHCLKFDANLLFNRKKKSTKWAILTRIYSVVLKHIQMQRHFMLPIFSRWFGGIVIGVLLSCLSMMPFMYGRFKLVRYRHQSRTEWDKEREREKQIRCISRLMCTTKQSS